MPALIASLRDRSLKAATANVVVGQGMADQLSARGVSASSIRVIANWTDDEEIRPLASNDNPLRRKWDLEGKFVVGYSGNLGRPHEYRTVLDAAEQLRGKNTCVDGTQTGFGHDCALAKLSARHKFYPSPIFSEMAESFRGCRQVVGVAFGSTRYLLKNFLS